jgi:hypothetical protein
MSCHHTCLLLHPNPNLHHQSAVRCIETDSPQLPANTMAPSIASSGHAPTTLTLKPFHTDPQPRQTQTHHYRLPRIAQQAPPPRSTPFAPVFSQSVSAATSRNPRSIPSSSLSIARPSVVNTRNTPRAPNVTNFAKSSDALVHHPISPPSTRTARQPVSTVARIHAIAPFGATSIDSVLHAGSTQDASKHTVPDHIRPKSEAIKYGRTQTHT